LARRWRLHAREPGRPARAADRQRSRSGRPGAGYGAPDQRSAGDRARFDGTKPGGPLFQGEPEFPLTDAEIASKFDQNASTLYAMEHVNKIRDIILDIENRHVREMTAMLKAG
jgi:hypothetical protein